MSEVKATYSNSNPGFSAMLRARVDEYIVANKGKLTGNFKLYIKTAILLTALTGFYVLLITQVLPIWADIIVCVLLGINLAAIGFNLMHEGAHGTFSRKRWVNELMGYTLNL